MYGRLRSHPIVPLPHFRIPGHQLVLVQPRLESALLHIPNLLLSLYLLQVLPLLFVFSDEPILDGNPLLEGQGPGGMGHGRELLAGAP